MDRPRSLSCPTVPYVCAALCCIAALIVSHPVFAQRLDSALPPPLLVHNGRLSQQHANGSITQVQLHGVAGTSMLFCCVANVSLYDGPVDHAYIAAMRTWGIEVVRVPLNEDCMLGINGVGAKFGGRAYQAALAVYVERLLRWGMYVILELHWTAAGSARAVDQKPMPDWNHAPAFWTAATKLFGHQRQVVFDLFNEPWPGNNTWDSKEAWECWKHGNASCTDIVGWTAIGFDDLVAIVRAAGSQNVLMLGGINYANSLTRWVEYAPTFDRNIAASFHSYNFNWCFNAWCWNSTVLSVLQQGHAVITGELGENDCGGSYITPLIEWLNTVGQRTSFLAWIWAPWNCDKGPALIVDYNGTCTDSYGCTYKALIARP